MWSSLLTAQDKRVVTGVVRDSTGQPLVAVNYQVKGTKLKGITDESGFFKVTLPAGIPQPVLVFSAVGYRERSVQVQGKDILEVSLAIDAGNLNEVVVTGFGEKRSKRGLGYAVTQVAGEDIRRYNPINPIAGLQGMVPGMQVQSGVAGPQATTRFLIRGSASLDPYRNQPLVVIDDIVMDQDVVIPNRGGDQDFGNILKDLNPDDIESVSVLKGGAVTALYGSRAANGIIYIKTKKGFSQKGLGISFSESALWDKAYKTMDLQNEFGGGSNTKDFITGADGTLEINPANYFYNYGPPIAGQTVKDITGLTRKNVSNDVLSLFRQGFTNNANVAISGGNEKGTFRLSYSNLYSNGVTPNNNFKRNSVSFRGTQRLANKVMVDANVSYVKSDAYNPNNQGENGLLRNTAWAARNYDMDYWNTHYINEQEGGSFKDDIIGLTPVLYILYEDKLTQAENNLRGSVDIKAALTNWLEFQGNASVNYLGQNYEGHLRGRNAGFMNPEYQSSIRNVTVGRYRGNFNVTKRINELNFMLQAGAELNTSRSKYAYYKTNGAILPDVYRLSNTKDAATITEDPPNKTQLSSAFFQGSIAFKDYLTLNLYGRNDWNSTLVYNDGHGHFSYFYPGADVAWVFTDAFKAALPKAIDYGKLRVSYVSSGNGTMAYKANTGAYKANAPYVDRNGTSVTNYQYKENELPNQNLIPERSIKFETGLEFKLLHNRLGGDFTFYTQDTKNQIISFDVPATSGVPRALVNGGLVRNRGIELHLFGTPVKTRNFSWDVAFNYTRNRNTVVTLPLGAQSVRIGGGDGYDVIAKAGGEYGALTARYAYARYQAKDAGGNNISDSKNGKRVLAAASAYTSYYVRASNYADGLDKQPVLGSVNPDFLGNLRNTFNYKNFQFSVTLDAKYGGMVYSYASDFGQWVGSTKSTLPYRTKERGGLSYVNSAGAQMENGVIIDGVYQRGTSVKGLDGQTHDLSGMTMKEAYDKGWVNPTSSNSYYSNTHSWGNGIREEAIFTSSWVSVQQAFISYDLPAKIAGKFKCNGLRVSVIGNNLFYLYNSAKDHVNPVSFNDSGSGASTETSGIPYIRSYGFSLNASF
ncbi:outer membrane protein, nutrient binding [Filimonas lacunae]|nr:outer membrane protein, nutrient binding [Filimonas lacunae]